MGENQIGIGSDFLIWFWNQNQNQVFFEKLNRVLGSIYAIRIFKKQNLKQKGD
jgi:hypothetical protein